MEQKRIVSGAKPMKIIAVTANAFEDDRNTFLEAGMDDIMNKPINIEELQKMLYV